MYLKSIEVQGFKSFANKIKFEFHNGITGIVGPNGSGKSNVADAVRWVLGEQRAKQLRGANMQDVIFSGTENRKPLGYAYVAITLDNSDHVLSVDYEEVTVSRRVYRSGESEYFINKTLCRLKDVHELFYDTGIGKEGYSIIGQGQIEKILNGKPEERRELFDEAAGIVKFKRRKADTIKKLENEKVNLSRVNDIITELEKQVIPLKEQSQKAKIYISQKEQLKIYDVNMFLLENRHIKEQLKSNEESLSIDTHNLLEIKKDYEHIGEEYNLLETKIEQKIKEITSLRDEISNIEIEKGRLEGQINLLNEQISNSKNNKTSISERITLLNKDISLKNSQNDDYKKEILDIKEKIASCDKLKTESKALLESMQQEIKNISEQIENGKSEVIELLNSRGASKAEFQKFDTMIEQQNIKKAEINKQYITLKSKELIIEEEIQEKKQIFESLSEKIEKLVKAENDTAKSMAYYKSELSKERNIYDNLNIEYHKVKSKLDSLKNLAQRYDGYGNSIKKVMEHKAVENGIIGVVADIIKVSKKYELAVETALGGSIQNIVTDDENTARRVIDYLKNNRLGRSTFLPLSSVGNKKITRNENVVSEDGVIGFADSIVDYEQRFSGIIKHLLGRIVVVDCIDNAMKIARKFGYSLRIVTLEGELLNPGGSMTGGAFKNASNLLGRKRELDELSDKVIDIKSRCDKSSLKIEDYLRKKDEVSRKNAQIKEELQSLYLEQNTAKINYDNICSQKDSFKENYDRLDMESANIERQYSQLNENRINAQAKIKDADLKISEIQKMNDEYTKQLNIQKSDQENYNKKSNEINIEYNKLKQNEQFVLENIKRIDKESKTIIEQISNLQASVSGTDENINEKNIEIEKIKVQISDMTHKHKLDTETVEKFTEQKSVMEEKKKKYFDKRDVLSEDINRLDKEVFRLKNNKEKFETQIEAAINYMWEEYELTYHACEKLENKDFDNIGKLNISISKIKEKLKNLGDVNVNAIEDYKEVSQRYEFLSTQRDDLVKAAQMLRDIIEELDTGMQKQFKEKFSHIQSEFNKVFKELFGGGKGTLELVEEANLLESGITITAQPPGKKLQNMMQLSGGEKSLTAIALLFAIQNLKPSPFCMLDEIEAALDDSNVTRFANYLHKLTKSTQFIIITHRRGTMAAADRLYGITMQEKGVSTLVSVNLIEDELDKEERE